MADIDPKMLELAKLLSELSASPAMVKVKQISARARAEGLDEKAHDELFASVCKLVSGHPDKIGFLREHVIAIIDATVEFGPESFEYMGKFLDRMVGNAGDAK